MMLREPKEKEGMADDLIGVAEREQALVVTEPPKALAKQEPPSNPVLAAIVALARDPSVDASKFKDLVMLQEHMEERQAQAQFNADFVVMQPELPRIKKDGTLKYPVDKNKPDGPQRVISKYATWEAIDETIRPILTAHGFALSFSTARAGDGVLTVSAILRHRGGHSTETAGPPLPCDSSGGKNNIQGWGSALSYGKRYAATAALNLVTEAEDDDGKLAGMSFLKSEQLEELKELMADTSTDERRFLDLFGVSDLSDLQQSHHVVARNMLLQKREMAKAKKGAA